MQSENMNICTIGADDTAAPFVLQSLSNNMKTRLFERRYISGKYKCNFVKLVFTTAVHANLVLRN